MNRRAILTLGASLLLGACAAPVPEAGAEADAASGTVASATSEATISSAAMPANAPLIEIMQGLSADMNGVLQGLWLEDPEAVAYYADRIANHSRVTAEEMGVIQGALGSDFATFVSHDQRVHFAAVALVDAVASGSSVPDLLSVTTDIQEGCVSCHETFRERVLEARAASGG